MADTDHCKLFVGGISWETNEEVLRHHFARYGTVLTSVIARDRDTGSPRGFAFVTFSDSSAADLALRDSHEILSRTVEVKRAIPKGEQQDNNNNNRGFNRNTSNIRINNGSSDSNEQFRTKKIFVGGLPANLTEEEFRAYFEQFGRIMDVVVMHDNVTRRPRGFGFIQFDSEDSVDDVIGKYHEVCGKVVEVKKAVPKDGMAGAVTRNGLNGRQSIVPEFNSFQNGAFSPFDPSFGYFPGYFAGYPMHGAAALYPSGFGYGMAPNAVRSPSMAGVGGSFMPYYFPAPMFPYFNGALGMQGFGVNGYNGNLGVRLGGSLTQPGGVDGQYTYGSTPSTTGKSILDANSSRKSIVDSRCLGQSTTSDSAGENRVKGNDAADSNSS